jgi:ferric-dicitrate binding protein FerR (iron transport regulator)
MNDADIEAVMAWKNDQFMMEGTDLGALTRQMARWYDVEIIFEGKLPDKKFGGSVSRNVNLSTMLEALSENGIRNKIEENKVTIYE